MPLDNTKTPYAPICHWTTLKRHTHQCLAVSNNNMSDVRTSEVVAPVALLTTFRSLNATWKYNLKKMQVPRRRIIAIFNWTLRHDSMGGNVGLDPHILFPDNRTMGGRRGSSQIHILATLHSGAHCIGGWVDVRGWPLWTLGCTGKSFTHEANDNLFFCRSCTQRCYAHAVPTVAGYKHTFVRDFKLQPWSRWPLRSYRRFGTTYRSRYIGKNCHYSLRNSAEECSRHIRGLSRNSRAEAIVKYTTPNKRVWKLPTSTQLRATWHTDSLDMIR
jgi:hypothetical protein